MITDRKKKGRLLELEDFKKYPYWSRAMIAYRLLVMMTPTPLSKKLRKFFRFAQVHPDCKISDNIVLPVGVIVTPPEGIEPTTVTAEDGTISDVVIIPDSAFPAEWAQAEPVIIEPAKPVAEEPYIVVPEPEPPLPEPEQPVPEEPAKPIGIKKIPDFVVKTPLLNLPANATAINAPIFTGIFGAGPLGAGKSAVPTGGAWGEYTDDTFWTQTLWHFTWTGSAWHKLPGLGAADIKVNTATGWASGLCPYKIRLTYTGPPSNFTLTDNHGHWVLGPDQSLLSEEIADFTLSEGNDIQYLSIANTSDDVYITKIEFFA